MSISSVFVELARVLDEAQIPRDTVEVTIKVSGPEDYHRIAKVVWDEFSPLFAWSGKGHRHQSSFPFAAFMLLGIRVKFISTDKVS